MFQIEALNAFQGDCLLLRWGDEHFPKTALIDGGPTKAWETTLRPRLDELRDVDEPICIDLAVVSHVDADHIGGIMRLLEHLVDARDQQRQLSYVVDRLWHNNLPAEAAEVLAAVDQNSGVGRSAESQSITQGNRVLSMAESLGILVNEPFGMTLSAGMRHTVEGLQLTVLAPNQQRLTDQWRVWRKRQLALDVKAGQAQAAGYDDKNPFNQASIVLLAEHDGKTALLCGDARGDQLISALESAELLSGSDALHVDVFKVPHHGSPHSNSPGLFDRIHADHYIISADGTYGHPAPELLDWIVSSRQTDNYQIHLTNELHNMPPGLREDRVDVTTGRHWSPVVEVRSALVKSLLIDL